MSKLIHLGEHVLHSGLKSNFKLIADQFIEDNLEELVYLIKEVVGPFRSVEGIPAGGTRLAEALIPHTVSSGMGVPFRNLHLIIDDVMTTGGSMERARQQHRGQGPAGRPGIIGVVVFTRISPPPWIRAIFTLPSELWPSLSDD